MQSFGPSPSTVPVLHPLSGKDEQLVPDDEFTIFHLWSQLIGELFTIFGWYEGILDPELQQGALDLVKSVSIFAGTTPNEELKVFLSVLHKVSGVAWSPKFSGSNHHIYTLKKNHHPPP